MNLTFNPKIAASYKNNSQKIRVLSEDWVDKQIFCPNCGLAKIDQYENNKPVADFYCTNCNEEYELKSKKDSIGNKIVDGAYDSMIKRLSQKNNPNFFFLTYNPIKLDIENFLVIPKHYFVPDIIEKRNPLSEDAKRADWVGCNILLKKIPVSGRIFYIKNKIVEPKKSVLHNWQKTLFLRSEKDITVKGWLLDVMRCVDKIDKKEFTLKDIYYFESELQILHPENKHIKDKIRQQLQLLRDRDYLKFTSRGNYKLI